MSSGNDLIYPSHDAQPRTNQHWERREFVKGMAALAGAAGLFAYDMRSSAAEPPPETTKLRIGRPPSICVAPQFVAEELLRAEGFTDVQYVSVPTAGLGMPQWRALASGELHINMAFSGPLIIRIEAGDPILLLAGIHVGCFELFGTEHVRSISDLNGKAVAVPALEGVHHVFVASMATYVGVDPKKDINWVTMPTAEAKQQLADGKIDAYLGFPPDPQELRAKKVGHVIVNSNIDRPWSQYFCCTLVANRQFVELNPVATKRALRAILKATDMCASEPERVASFLVDKGYTTQREYAVQALKAIPFNRWREYDAEDTVRFFALRLHEAGMIKSTPQKIIAQGTDWRFLNELKKELKG